MVVVREKADRGGYSGRHKLVKDNTIPMSEIANRLWGRSKYIKSGVKESDGEAAVKGRPGDREKDKTECWK